MKLSSFSLAVLCTLCASLFISCSTPHTLQEVKYQSVLMDSIKICYKTYGSGHNNIVFVHGFGCDINAWSEQFSYFCDKARMVFIDLPGFGQSDKPHTDYTLDFYADAVKTVMDALKIRGAVLVGHSLGTPVCRQAVLKYPDLASRLVDIDGVYCFYPAPPEMVAMYEAFAESFNNKDITQVLKDFTAPLNTPQTPAEVVDYAMTIMPQTPSYVAYSTMRNMISEKYWDGTIIEIPALVIASVNSQIPPDYNQIMSTLYAKMEYHELSDTGHFIMMERPQMFNEMLEQFIIHTAPDNEI